MTPSTHSTPKIPSDAGDFSGNTGHVASGTVFQSIKRRDSAGSGSASGPNVRSPTMVRSPSALAHVQMTLNSQMVPKKLRDNHHAAELEPPVLQSHRLRLEIDEANRSIQSLERRLEMTKKLQSMDEISDRKRSNTFTSIYSVPNNVAEDSSSSTSVLMTPQDDVVARTGGSDGPNTRLGEVLQQLGDKDLDKHEIVDLANELVSLLRDHPEVKADLVLGAFASRIQMFLTSPVSEVRACGYRIARYVLHDEDSLRMLIQLRIELFLIVTFARDNKALLEKEQALKLIREVIELPDGVYTLTVGLVRAIVAIAESPDDKLSKLCIETLCEISLFAPGLVYKSDGLKIILQSFVEGPYHVAAPCILTVLKLMESPETREYVIDPTNISYFVSSFCDVQQKGHNNIERLQNNAFMLTILLKTWSGLVCLAQDDFSLIRDLINCLTFDIPNLRDILMDIFFDVLKIRTLPWIKNSTIFGYSNNQNRSLAPEAPSQHHKTKITSSDPEKNNPVVNHYTSLLLVVLLKCNITNKLVHLVSNTDDDLNKRKGIYLLTEIVSLSSNLIPEETLHSLDNFDTFLPILMENKYVDFRVPSAPVFQMARLSDRLSKGRLGSVNVVIPGHDKGMSFHVRYNLDDIEFRKMLNDTRILTTKEYEHWNWDLISDLMEGPLLNGKRLEETIRTTKVMKRLMSFYRPFKFRFSKISKKNKRSGRYVKIGCQIFETLLHSSEGVKFLAENKLLAQIAECIAQVDPYSGITSTDSLFSKHKLETTMCSGYFKMLGVLSRDPNGLRMLAQWKIFSMMYHITDAKRTDLIRLIIEVMDYKNPSHLRIIFNKVLTTASVELRVFATKHLAVLIKESAASDTSTPSTSNNQDFLLKLLLNQLYDSNKKVIDVAVGILDDYISQPHNLDKIVELLPDVLYLSKIGNWLPIKFLATSRGYKYLSGFRIIEKELKEWTEYKMFQYVYDIENLLIHDLIQPETHNDLIFKQSSNERLFKLDNFFGQLAKVDEGVELINETGIIEKCSKNIKIFIKEYMPTGPDEVNRISEEQMVELKGYLWCIGHICSTREGVKLIDNRHLIEDIIELTENCTNLSLKGTCFLVLGLISTTLEGLEILDESQWHCKANINNQLIGVCIPADLNRFFDLRKFDEFKLNKQIKFENYVNLNSLVNNEFSSLNYNDLMLMKKIFENFVNLLSHLLTSKSLSNLKNIKFKNEMFFHNERNGLILLKILLKLISNFKFSKSVRKFLLNDLVDCLYFLKVLGKKDRLKVKG